MSLDTEPIIITTLLLAPVLFLMGSAPQSSTPGAEKAQQVLDLLDTAGYPSVNATLTEAEVNAWLQDAFAARPYLGVLSSQAKLFAGNYVSTYTVVDLDVLKRSRPMLFPPPLNMVFSGRSAFWIDFRIDTATGRLRLKFEKALINGVQKPPGAFAAMVRLVALRKPEKYDVISGARMPYRLKTIQVSQGRITLIR